MQEELTQLRKDFEELKSLYYKDNFSTSQTIRKDVLITGKFGVNGNTPVAKASAITAPSGGATIDSESRTAINLIRTVLTNVGLTL